MFHLKRRTARTPAVDLAGQTFGRWAVLSRAAVISTDGARWRCSCTTCGNVQTARSSDIRRGRVACLVCKESAHA